MPRRPHIEQPREPGGEGYDPLDPDWVQARNSAENEDYLRAIAFGLIHQNTILTIMADHLKEIRNSLGRAYPPQE